MADRPRDPDLPRLAEDLSTTLADLRDELDQRPEPPRGPLGIPRPPTPGELLRFSDEFAIPAVIAVLEANIRALEAFRAALRLARTGEELDRRGREARARTGELSRGALDQLDGVLAELQDAIEGQPRNAEARGLLDDARALRAEIDDRLRESERRSRGRSNSRGNSRDDPADPWSDDEDADEGVTIDVDAELDSIHDAVDAENEDDDDDIDSQ